MTDYARKYQMTPVIGWLLNDRGGMILLGILIAAAILVPASNLLLPESSAFHVPTWMVSLLASIRSRRTRTPRPPGSCM